jgi:hypothetical protein
MALKTTPPRVRFHPGNLFKTVLSDCCVRLLRCYVSKRTEVLVQPSCTDVENVRGNASLQCHGRKLQAFRHITSSLQYCIILSRWILVGATQYLSHGYYHLYVLRTFTSSVAEANLGYGVFNRPAYTLIQSKSHINITISSMAHMPIPLFPSHSGLD